MAPWNLRFWLPELDRSTQWIGNLGTEYFNLLIEGTCCIFVVVAFQLHHVENGQTQPNIGHE